MSANDILSNFTDQLTKTQITNALDALTASEKIIEKIYGKQKVYMALQTANTVTLKQDLRDLEEKKFMAKAEMSRLNFDSNNIQTELNGFGNETPIETLQEEKKELFNEVEDLKQVLSKYRAAKQEVVSKEDKKKV